MDSRVRLILIAVAIAVMGYFFLHKKEETVVRAMVDPPAETAGREAEVRTPIATEGLNARVSTYSGGVRDLTITGAQFRDLRTHQPMSLSNTWREYAEELRSNVRFERAGINVLPAYLTYDVVRQAADQVELVANPPGSDVEVRRTIRARSEYAFTVTTRVINHGAPGVLAHSQAVFHFVRRSDEEAKFFFLRQPWQRSEALCHHDGHLLREWREELTKHGEAGAHDADFVGLGNLYFLTALANDGAEHADCIIRSDDTSAPGESEPSGALLRGLLVWHPTPVASGESHEYRVVAYFGPKYPRLLSAASPSLHEAVNLGYFSIIARALLRLLQFLYGITRNWGVAIILLTVLIRGALYPVLSRSARSMAMMQKLKPELDAVNAKYADNAEQRGLATMELYRKHKINPVAGCLPQLAQLPVWWALYATLQTSVELFHAPFALWLRDLSAPDPFFVLPLILGGTVFVQQKLMPASMPDPAQQKMMLYFMPVMLTGISLLLPSGLALYMLVNSVLGMTQQKLTKAQIDRLAAKMPDEAITVRSLETSDDAKKDSGSTKNGGRRGGRR